MNSTKKLQQPKKAWHIAEDVFFSRKPSYKCKFDIESEINTSAAASALGDGDLCGFALMAGSSRTDDGLKALFGQGKEYDIETWGDPSGRLPRVKRIMSKESIDTWNDFIGFLKLHRI